jgi:hypothetical protein
MANRKLYVRGGLDLSEKNKKRLETYTVPLLGRGVNQSGQFLFNVYRIQTSLQFAPSTPLLVGARESSQYKCLNISMVLIPENITAVFVVTVCVNVG